MDRNDLAILRAMERELTKKIIFLHNVVGELQNGVLNIGNVVPGLDHRIRKLEGRELLFDEHEDGTLTPKEPVAPPSDGQGVDLAVNRVDPEPSNVVQFPVVKNTEPKGE